MIDTNTIHVTQELLALLSEIDEFKGAWRALGTIAPERLNALRRVATIESIGSSTRIEGSKLTDREVERLLGNLEIKRFSTRDEQEVAGYAAVMETIFLSWSDIHVTENHIKQLHRDLLQYSDKDERHRGEYKTLRNDVGAFDAESKMIGIVFETATPFDTPQQMTELVAWLNQARELRRLHPLLIVAVFIVVFLAIHPFQDGNGRLSRVLTTLLLLQAGYAYVPYSSLESVIENSKREKNALAALSELAVKILDYVRDQGRVTTRDMVREEGASPNTLKATFTSLVEKGLLVRHGAGRSTWYGLP
jgi:Fic family protein